MTRGGGDAKRQLRVLVFSWLLVVSVVGASSIVVGGTGAESAITDSSAAEPSEALRAPPTIMPATIETATPTTIETATPTTNESPRPLEPRFDFACEQVAVTARGYDSVTLVFDDDRQTFRWSFRGRNVFFGTGENVGAVVAEVVVRRDGERIVRRNPDFEACAGRNATAATIATTGTGTTLTTTTTTTTAATAATTTTPATATTPATTATGTTVATTATGTTAATATTATTTATVPATSAVQTTAITATSATTTTLDLPTIGELTTTATTPLETTVRGTTATVPTPTVTPQPIAGYPECSDEEFGLTSALNLTYENGTFTSPNATEIAANRFRFTAGNETYVVELVRVERNEQGQPVSVTFDATPPVNAVVVRSGQGANVYEFPEGVSRRASLRAPTNENTGQPFVIEEIAFCYDSETPNGAESGGGSLSALGLDFDLGLDLLVGRDATVAVGLAAAGLLAMRRRRSR